MLCFQQGVSRIAPLFVSSPFFGPTSPQRKGAEPLDEPHPRHR